jgi:hypothetical protein
MPAGASQKREREYKKLKKRFKERGRYKGREEEVASRIVNKQRKQHSETKKAKAKDKRGESPDQDLPIEHYDHLTAGQVKQRLKNLSGKETRQIQQYEKKT